MPNEKELYTQKEYDEAVKEAFNDGYDCGYEDGYSHAISNPED